MIIRHEQERKKKKKNGGYMEGVWTILWTILLQLYHKYFREKVHMDSIVRWWKFMEA